MVQTIAPTCPTCGAAVSISPGARGGQCEYCQTDVLVVAAPAKPAPQQQGWRPLPQWQPPAQHAPQYGAGYAQQMNAQVHAHMAHAQQQQQQATKVVLWIVIGSVVAPLILTFFFVMLGMCAAIAS